MNFKDAISIPLIAFSLITSGFSAYHYSSQHETKKEVEQADVIKIPHVSETLFLALLNENRKHFNLKPLVWNSDLKSAALSHAKDFSKHEKDMDHIGSDGSTPSNRANDSGYTARIIGEGNYAGTAILDIQKIINILLTTHKDLLTNPDFTDVAIARVINNNSTDKIFWTVVFAAK